MASRLLILLCICGFLFFAGAARAQFPFQPIADEGPGDCLNKFECDAPLDLPGVGFPVVGDGSPTPPICEIDITAFASTGPALWNRARSETDGDPVSDIDLYTFENSVFEYPAEPEITPAMVEDAEAAIWAGVYTSANEDETARRDFFRNYAGATRSYVQGVSGRGIDFGFTTDTLRAAYPSAETLILRPQDFSNNCNQHLRYDTLAEDTYAFFSTTTADCQSVDAYLNDVFNTRTGGVPTANSTPLIVHFEPGEYLFFNPVLVPSNVVFSGPDVEPGCTSADCAILSKETGIAWGGQPSDPRNRAIFHLGLSTQQVGIENVVIDSRQLANIVSVPCSQGVQLRNLDVRNRGKAVFQHASDIVVAHSSFANPQSDAVFDFRDKPQNRGLRAILIENNRFADLANEAIDFGSQATGINISNNIFFGKDVREGYRLTGEGPNPDFYDTLCPDAYGTINYREPMLYVRCSVPGSCDGVRDVFAEEVLDIGDSVGNGSSPIEDVTISGNFFGCYGKFSAAMRVKQATTNIRIDGNTFSHCGNTFRESGLQTEYDPDPDPFDGFGAGTQHISRAQGASAVVLSDARRGLVIRNRFHQTGRGVFLTRGGRSSSQISVFGNTFEPQIDVIQDTNNFCETAIKLVPFEGNLSFNNNLVRGFKREPVGNPVLWLRQDVVTPPLVTSGQNICEDVTLAAGLTHEVSTIRAGLGNLQDTLSICNATLGP